MAAKVVSEYRKTTTPQVRLIKCVHLCFRNHVDTNNLCHLHSLKAGAIATYTFGQVLTLPPFWPLAYIIGVVCHARTYMYIGYQRP